MTAPRRLAGAPASLPLAGPVDTRNGPSEAAHGHATALPSTRAEELGSVAFRKVLLVRLGSAAAPRWGVQVLTPGSLLTHTDAMSAAETRALAALMVAGAREAQRRNDRGGRS